MIWGSGIYYGQYVKEYYQEVSIRMGEAGVSEEKFMSALQYEEVKNPKNIPRISAWNRLEEQTIENGTLATSYKSQLIEVSGDIRQVYPMKLAKGNILTPEDYEGCMIDQEMAYKLFGAVDAVGNTVTYQNKQYYIRGIIKSPEPVIFFQMNDKKHTYSNMELVYDDMEKGQELAKAFMEQNNLATSYTVLDGAFYSGIIAGFCKAPAWLLGFYMLGQILMAIWKRRTIPLQVAVLLVALISAWLLLKWLLGFQINLPERFIPTKWSDFSFWAGQYKELREQIGQTAYLTPTVKDIIFLRYVKRCIAYTLISLAGMWIFALHIRSLLGKTNGFCLAALAVMLECGAIVILYITGKVFLAGNGYLYMLPIFIMAEDLVNKGKSWIKAK